MSNRKANPPVTRQDAGGGGCKAHRPSCPHDATSPCGPSIFQLIKEKVVRYPDENLVWVKNFIKRQSKSPKFLAAAAKYLTLLHNNGAIAELLKYNLDKYSISIPYPYPMDTVAVPPAAAAAAVSDAVIKEGGVVKGGEELAVISHLYEENIGILNTPLLAEELKDIADRYSPGWFEEAVKEAVFAGHRNLRYIKAILERWKIEGFKSPRRKGGSNGTYRLPDKEPSAERYRQSLKRRAKPEGKHDVYRPLR